MRIQIKTSSLFFMFTFFMCVNFFFLPNTNAQVSIAPVAAPEDSNYTFESIEVEGVQFLALTASSDFDDYAGYTQLVDGEKEVAFTLIDGVFATYDFPGSQKTRFYALGNNGNAAGYYVDSEGLHRGVVLEDGELRQSDFPDSVQTEIWGISDATGALTGNYIDASGVRRGFTGNEVIEYPGAVETYADFVSGGRLVGSYIDAEGIYHAYIRFSDGFTSIDLPDAANLDYYFVHGINDAGVYVARSQAVGDIPRTHVATYAGQAELRVPGSVSTEGYNINQDGSVVGNYDTENGQRHGFIAKPRRVDEPARSTYTYQSIDVPGVDYLEVTSSSDFGDYAGNTRSADGKTIAFTLIDGVFMKYDYPGSQNTYFYALGNDGRAAGHYQDSDGLHHGVILENGELRQYDFPDAVETFIYGISDATGVLTGSFIDAEGIRRGFSGDITIEYPGAVATYADFVNASGIIVGSYIDAEGVYHAYTRFPDGNIRSIDFPQSISLEYFFVHGINDAGITVTRVKRVGDISRTYVSTLQGTEELQFPGSVSTEGWNINQDGSVVGHYRTGDDDVRVHGFIARPTTDTDAPTEAQVTITPIAVPEDSEYTFESIEVEGVQFLALTASSDFDDYAGYTQLVDGEKEVAFTIIDGVFMTYDFPGSQETRFYALGNNGDAAGYYVDSEGLHQGVVLRDGELRQYDFPDSVQTEIWGISDATGALTGNYIDASGVRRGFTGNEVIEYPGAVETYADFVSAGRLVGSYIDAEGIYHAYIRFSDGFTSIDLPDAANLDYYFVHGINDAGVYVARSQAVGDIPRTHVATYAGQAELRVPGSVSTEGYNINQDGSVVGNYDTENGQRHGFIAKPRRVDEPARSTYTYQSIDVPGVDYLEVTSSSDFGDYAGNTRSADGKTIAFTLIDGVFMKYDYPGSQNTYFYALGNDGRAAGHYEDSDGLHHGVILENGELRQYDFPGAVETFIYGISDATGVLTGSFIDAEDIRRGFSGEITVEYPGAVATYADFVNASGIIVGSYIDAEGVYHAYTRFPDGNIRSIDFPQSLSFEYFFVHGINDAGITVTRAKGVGDISRTYVSTLQGTVQLQFPGSVSTHGWNINQDGSVVGHYESADGRRHGFIARPADEEVSKDFGNFFNVTLAKGLNMLSVPLAPTTPMNARSLAGIAGATTVITLDTANQQFVGWTPDAPDDGFPIEGGKGYIVSVPEARNFAFVGSRWTNQTEGAAAPAISTEMPKEAWAFVVSGNLEGPQTFDGYQVIVRNLRTNGTITTSVREGYFAAATADLARRSVAQVGDMIEVRVLGPDGNVESQTRSFKVTPDHLANAVLSVNLDNIGQPTQNQLLQNYPNPFNPETWIPYQLSEDSAVSVSIYDASGKLVRTLSLGTQSAGFYNSRERAAYWDGRNALGESVASGVYFYQLTTPSFQQTRRLVIVK